MSDVMKMPFFETSAKDASNVEAVFRTITAKILEGEWMLPNDNAWQQNSICLHDYPDGGIDFGVDRKSIGRSSVMKGRGSGSGSSNCFASPKLCNLS